MPIYEYACKSCDAKFDQLVRAVGTTPKVKCPKCGSPSTVRTLSVFAVTSDSAKSSSPSDAPTCGRCGGPPGSCSM